MNASRRRRYDPNTMAATENSIWDVYNNIADTRDDELIKDWNDSLNFLLIFAAIFAAVLTALIVESMKLLQEDTQDLTAAILLTISKQLANDTTPAYVQTEFQVPQYAVVVNSLLFSSLCCSLVTALAAVIALQWVNEYDARIDTVDTKKRALIRHFRFIGVQTWKMGEIIAILPMLLHAAVFLFFSGLIIWLGDRHRIIFYICIGGGCVAIVFYLATILLAGIFSDSPFRSPMARVLRHLIYGSAQRAIKALEYIVHTLRSHNLQLELIPLNIRYPLISLAFIESCRRYTIYRRDTKSLEEKASQRRSLEKITTQWTMQHVEFGSQSTHRLVQILRYSSPLLTNRRSDGPWMEVLNQIAQSYLDKAASQELSQDDLSTINLLLTSWTSKYFKARRYFHRRLEDRTNWTNWTYSNPLLKLIGPLWVPEALTEAQASLILSTVQSRLDRNHDQAAQRLIDATRHLGPAHARQERQIQSYMINSLSLYLLDHSQGADSRRVAQRLSEMIVVPPGQLHIGFQCEVSLALNLAVLYSLAFGSTRRDYHHWGTLHPIMTVEMLGSESDSICTLHTAMTSRMAARVAQAPNTVESRNLTWFCRMLAYTPCKSVNSSDTARLKGIIAQLPGFLNFDSLDAPSTRALLTRIWLQKLQYIPRAHEYLEVLYNYQRRFPTQTPIWRDWTNIDALQLTSISQDDYNWIKIFENDRRILEVLQAFDRLIADGCSTDQQLIMIQLAIEDLLDEDVAIYKDYYTTERKAALDRLIDPALRLVGARAANIPYSGAIPDENNPIWSLDTWVKATEFWCTRYTECDACIDEALLVATLVQPHTALQTSLIQASSRNEFLEVQLRSLLRSKLDLVDNNRISLLTHVAARSATWFHDYIQEPLVLEKLLGAVTSNDATSPRILPLLSTLIPFITTLNDVDGIIACAERMLAKEDSYLGKREAEEVTMAFEKLAKTPPQWIRVLDDTGGDWWIQTASRLRSIVQTVGEHENAVRAMARWQAPHQNRVHQKRTPIIDVIAQVQERSYKENVQNELELIDTSQGWVGGYLRRWFGRSKGQSDSEESDIEDESSSEGEVINEDEPQEYRPYSCSAVWSI